jgi:hypothetical protein
MSTRDWKADVKAIRKILLAEWNPIGFDAFDVPDDEYDSYIGGIYREIQRGATAEQLAEYLTAIESGAIGLTVNPLVIERNLGVARSLIAATG